MGERIAIAEKTPGAKRVNLASKAHKIDLTQSLNSPVDQILLLQRTIGNQAVQRLFKSGVIQAKLKIGQPNDIYEQEADRIAEQVMRMPEPKFPECVEKEKEEELIQTKPISEYINPFIQRQVEQEVEEEEEESIQTKLLSTEHPVLQRQVEPEEEEDEKIWGKFENSLNFQRQKDIPEEERRDEKFQARRVLDQTPAFAPDLESRIQSLKGGGQPLPDSIRSYFEPRFGYDFSQVRVHTDSDAEKAAKSVNAKAFAIGKDVVFSAGHYLPETVAGKRLLAHELTHAVQQSRDGPLPSPLFGDSCGQEAERASAALGQSGETPILLTGGSVSRIARQAASSAGTGGTKFAPTVFHPGVVHNHQPTGRWAEVQNASSCSRGIVEYVCAHSSPLEVMIMAYTFELSGCPLARLHLLHFLGGGGADLSVNLEDVVQRDVGVRARLASEMIHSDRGWATIEQNRYDVQDFQYAFGTIDRLDFEVDSAVGLVHVWFKDRYEFHPVGFGYEELPGDYRRETNCVHAAAVELKASCAADYWMVGDAIVPLSLFKGPFTESIGTTERKERKLL